MIARGPECDWNGIGITILLIGWSRPNHNWRIYRVVGDRDRASVGRTGNVGQYELTSQRDGDIHDRRAEREEVGDDGIHLGNVEAVVGLCSVEAAVSRIAGHYLMRPGRKTGTEVRQHAGLSGRCNSVAKDEGTFAVIQHEGTWALEIPANGAGRNAVDQQRYLACGMTASRVASDCDEERHRLSVAERQRIRNEPAAGNAAHHHLAGLRRNCDVDRARRARLVGAISAVACQDGVGSAGNRSGGRSRRASRGARNELSGPEAHEVSTRGSLQGYITRRSRASGAGALYPNV